MTLETYVAWMPAIVIGVCGALVVVNVAFRRFARWLVRRHREHKRAILDAIEALQPNGTGFTITQEASRRLGRRVSVGAFYAYIDDLERKGVIASRWGIATAARGWNRPRHYWFVGAKPNTP